MSQIRFTRRPIKVRFIPTRFLPSQGLRSLCARLQDPPPSSIHAFSSWLARRHLTVDSTEDFLTRAVWCSRRDRERERERGRAWSQPNAYLVVFSRLERAETTCSHPSATPRPSPPRDTCQAKPSSLSLSLSLSLSFFLAVFIEINCPVRPAAAPSAVRAVRVPYSSFFIHLCCCKVGMCTASSSCAPAAFETE